MDNGVCFVAFAQGCALDLGRWRTHRERHTRQTTWRGDPTGDCGRSGRAAAQPDGAGPGDCCCRGHPVLAKAPARSAKALAMIAGRGGTMKAAIARFRRSSFRAPYHTVPEGWKKAAHITSLSYWAGISDRFHFRNCRALAYCSWKALASSDGSSDSMARAEEGVASTQNATSTAGCFRDGCRVRGPAEMGRQRPVVASVMPLTDIRAIGLRKPYPLATTTSR